MITNEVMWTLAAGAFVAIYFLKIPHPLIILTAAMVGLAGGKFWKEKFLIIRGHGKLAERKNLCLEMLTLLRRTRSRHFLVPLEF